MHLSVGEAATFLGVSVSTLRRWDKDRVLAPSYRAPGGHRRYSLRDLSTFAAVDQEVSSEKKINVAYGRVSSFDQRDDLERQIGRLREYCERQFSSFEIISDLGSGLKYDKRGLQKLLRLICQGRVANLVLTHRDRLLRFGSPLIFSVCEYFGTKVTIIEAQAPASYEEELSRDVIELITAFSAKLHGRRSHQNREAKKAA